MKRIAALLLALAVLVSFTACARSNKPGESTKSPSKSEQQSKQTKAESTAANKSPSQSTATNTSFVSKIEYKDGTYTGKGDPWEYGMEDATVVIKDKKIVDVTLRRLDKEGKAEVDYSLFDGKAHNGKLYPNLLEFKEKMAKEMIKKQKAGVEAISGATKSTTNWTLAAQRALDQAVK